MDERDDDAPKMVRVVTMIHGEVIDTNYKLTVTGLLTKAMADAYAQKMAAYATKALTEVMGGLPTSAQGSGLADVSDIERVSGVAVGNYKTLEDAVAALFENSMADDCQCPNCVARRAKEAEVGSNPNTAH